MAEKRKKDLEEERGDEEGIDLPLDKNFSSHARLHAEVLVARRTAEALLPLYHDLE